jgi:hypothetical protein
MNTGLTVDSNVTTQDDIPLLAISDGYLNGYWAQVDSNLDLHVTTRQNGSWQTKTLDGYGNPINSTIVAGATGLDVYVLNTSLPFSLSNDTNYGTVGSNTLRTAAQIGNSTGQADFNRGATSAQTLRVTNNTSDGYGTAISSTAISGKTGLDVNIIGSITTTFSTDLNYGTVGANTLRTAAQVGNATGAADFNVGATGAQTLRVTSNLNDGYGTKISSTIVSGKDGLDVNLINSTIAVTQSTSPWVVSGTVAVTQSTSPWVVSGTVTAAEDKNFGTVGANTLRVASQIGNATGAADFNRGVTSAQTLRVTNNTSDGYGTAISSTIVGGKDGLDVNLINSTIAVTQSTSPWVVSGTVTAAEDKNYGTVGANTLRTAAQVGNATGAADFNFGTVGAQTLRTAAELGNASGLADFNRGATSAQTLRTTSNLNDGYGIQIQSLAGSLNVNLTNPTVAVTQSTSPWVVSGTVTAAEDKNFGTVGANTLRSAAQIGNATGAADFNFGAASAQTLRTASLIGNATGAANFNYGAVGAQTLRTASQIGNATGAADFNFGASSAQTLRTASNLSDGYGNLITSAANSAGTKRPLDIWDTHGTPQHFNGTVGTSATTLTPSSTTTAILVLNPTTNASNVTLSVSFDGGTTFFDLIRGATLSIECEVSSLQIKGSSATTNYQILVTRR